MPFFSGPLSGALARARLMGRQGEQDAYQRQQEERRYEDNLMARELARSMQEREYGQRERSLQSAAEDRDLAREQAAALAREGAATRATAAEDAARAREDAQRRDLEFRAAEAQRQRDFVGSQNAANRQNALAIRTGGQQGRPLSQNLADNLGTFGALMATGDDALQKLDAAVAAGKDVTGAIRGRITGSIGQALHIPGSSDPMEVSARAALANVASSLMKERSGGAITPQEFVRLEPFLPSKTDDEAVARQKLVDLLGNLKTVREERLNALEASGWDVSGIRRSGGAGSAAARLRAAAGRIP